MARKVFRPPGADPAVFDEIEWRKRLVRFCQYTRIQACDLYVPAHIYTRIHIDMHVSKIFTSNAPIISWGPELQVPSVLIGTHFIRPPMQKREPVRHNLILAIATTAITTTSVITTITLLYHYHFHHR